ncbi:MAG: hypothetical protein IKF14_04970 [Atopobiaceae bacterium]|nr:hypothetical protein [Atopobiaceae bacterium]
MSINISQSDAAKLFDVPTVVLYVCDGKKECGKPSCSDLANVHACHHTADVGHALYDKHFEDGFDSYPTIRGEDDRTAVIIRVEQIRG